MSLISLTEQRS